MTLYAAIKGDLISSRKLPDRALVQKKLMGAMKAANTVLSTWVVSKFIVTHGDEFQALLNLDGARRFLDIYELVSEHLNQVSFRLALGVGEIETPLQPTAIGMDGPAWHRAKQALDQAMDTETRLRVQLPSAFLTRQTNLLLHAVEELEGEWRESHHAVISLTRENLSQEQIAARLGISQGAVSQRLKHARWRTYQERKDGLAELLAAAGQELIAPFDITAKSNKTSY